jgi:hypothetical protein
MFAKMGEKKWRGGEITKTLAKYFSLLGFGKNSTKTYRKAEDKPALWLGLGKSLAIEFGSW